MADEIESPVPGVAPVEQVPPAVTTPPVVEQKMVSLPADALQRILQRLDEQDSEMKILRSSVSQGKLQEAENKAKPAELPLGYLKVLQGKTIIGWKSEKGETIYHPSNPDVVMGENLKARYYFLEGGDSGIIDQVIFTRCEDRVTLRLLDGKDVLKTPNLKEVRVKCERLITADGNEDLKAEYKVPALEFMVNINFLNP